MPEGPEAKIIADRLGLTLIGTKITEIHLESTAKHMNLDKVPLGIEIVNVTAYGKRVRFQLEDGSEIVTALGMEGKWLFEESHNIETPNGGKLFNRSHSHIRITCGETLILFNDVRRFGWVEFISKDEVEKYFSRFGPDLLQTEVDSTEWQKIFTGKKWKNRQIGVALLDQELVAGIGNYLRADILFASHINPFKKVSELTMEELELLRINAMRIIRRAYETKGYSLGTYRDPDGRVGIYESLVYGRKRVEGFEVVKSQTSDKRTIWWVPELQG